MREKITLSSIEEVRKLSGALDMNLKAIEDSIGVVIYTKDSQIVIEGEEDRVGKARKVLKQLLSILRSQGSVDIGWVKYAIDSVGETAPEDTTGEAGVIDLGFRGKKVVAKTPGQVAYIEAIRKNDITFGIGPAGTGKTFLAVAMALHYLFRGTFNRIIITRPVVEAGESLGYLPGTFIEKIDPYIRPIYDALYDLLGPDRYEQMLARGIIEIAPLAYMRGRTLNNAFIILDEAQNTTKEQMKMFLTRMGPASKIVVTGDVSQSDLPRDKLPGLLHAFNILKGIEGIEFVELTSMDVVRHPLVQKIIEAYEEEEKRK